MRPIDADDITATLEIAISMMENTKSIIGVENLPAIDVEIKAYTDILKGIKEQPTVQPEPQWILCDEKMPEEHEWLGTKKFGTTISDEVYVTFENPKGERFCQHLSFQNGKLSAFDKSTIDAFYKGSKPIAWMPLPEPYAERRTE